MQKKVLLSVETDYPSQTTIQKEEPFAKFGSFFIKKNILVETVSNIDRCFKLWKEFSPKKNIFDTWEFRFAFYKAYKHEPYFMLLKSDSENLALLPLWHNKEEKRYEWFGSTWQEEVDFFAKKPEAILSLLSVAPSPLHLNAITRKSVEPLKRKIDFKVDDSKYILKLDGFKSHEDYLMTIKKNRRHDLRKDRRKIERQNPEIIINRFTDLKKLIDICQKRFEKIGEDTDWEDSKRIKTFQNVIKLSGKSYEARMITIKIGKKIAGVDLNCLFNKTYFAVKCGYNVREFSGIGNFMNLFEIDDAIKLGMKKIDFLQNNYEWKDRFFEAVPLYIYEKA